MNLNIKHSHCFIILYDLRAPGRNYSELQTAIKSFGTWGKITESAWAIVTDNSSVEIRDYLSRYIDSNDRIMVIRSGEDAAWRKVIADSEWLKTNLVK